MPKYMFFDDRHLADKDGFDCRVINPGRSFVAIKADRPWERMGLCGDSCMSVIDDDGVMKIWYAIYSPDEKRGSHRSLTDAERATLNLNSIPDKFIADILCPERYYLCYAYSNDGITWTKPELGIYNIDGSSANNVVFSGRLGSTVFIDPTAPPSERFKMIHGGSLRLPHWLNDRFVRMAYTGIYGATSPDGIHWTSTVHPIMPHYTDSTNVCFYDPEQRTYVAFVRTDKNMVYDNGRTVMLDPEHRTYRIISRSESSDFFDFPAPEEVMSPRESEIQDYLSHGQSKSGMDLYNSAAMKYEFADGVYFLFPSYFHHDTDEAVVHIATGRDSRNFTRHDSPLILPENAPTFRSPQQYLACGMLPSQNDGLLLFSNAYSVGHNELGQADKWESAIVGHEFQKDGFIGQFAEQGTMTTQPLETLGHRIIIVRAKIEQGGSLDVAVNDVAQKRIHLEFARISAANDGIILQAILPEGTSTVTMQFHAVKTTLFSVETMD